MIEGVQAGTAVLAADSGAFRELFTDERSIFLVSPDTPEAFAERFADIGATLGRHRPMAAAFAREFGDRFAPERHARTIEKVYARMISQPARGPLA